MLKEKKSKRCEYLCRNVICSYVYRLKSNLILEFHAFKTFIACCCFSLLSIGFVKHSFVIILVGALCSVCFFPGMLYRFVYLRFMRASIYEYIKVISMYFVGWSKNASERASELASEICRNILTDAFDLDIFVTSVGRTD